MQLERVDLEHVTIATEDSDDTVLAMHEALEKLALESPQKAEIVKLHYFTGLEYRGDCPTPWEFPCRRWSAVGPTRGRGFIAK